jgi:Derlin-2/3
VQLESVTYAGRTPDFAYMLIVLAAALLASTSLLAAPILSTSLISALVYVWSRANQTTNVSFFGLFSVPGFYLPFTLLAWTVVQGGDPVPDMRGIVAGHLYYFLATVWPRAGGPNLLTTPEVVKQAVHWAFGCVRRVALRLYAPPGARVHPPEKR